MSKFWLTQVLDVLRLLLLGAVCLFLSSSVYGWVERELATTICGPIMFSICAWFLIESYRFEADNSPAEPAQPPGQTSEPQDRE